MQSVGWNYGTVDGVLGNALVIGQYSAVPEFNFSSFQVSNLDFITPTFQYSNLLR
jgi:hypothetical protein